MERVNINVAPSISPRPMNTGHVTKSMMYVNETALPVYVTEPGGGHFTVLPDSSYAPTNRFTVFVTYRAGSRYAGFNGLSENLLPPVEYRRVVNELKQIGESTLKYEVDVSDIAMLLRGDMLIIKQLSIAISLQPIKMGNEVLENQIARTQQFQLGVAIVQPYEDTRPKRWVRYYSAMIEVTPMQSMLYDPGLYLLVFGRNCVEERQIRFDFDDPLCPLRAFESKEEAMKWKWRDSLSSVDVERNRLQGLVKEAETGLADRKSDMELEYKRKLADLNFEKESLAMYSRTQEQEIKARALARDDAYDERSTIRKSSSDALKVFPTLLALGATILGLM